MDTVRYFKEISKRQFKERRSTENVKIGLQNVQHDVATAAGFRSWASLLQAGEQDRQLAAVMHREPRLTREGFGAGYFARTLQQRRADFVRSREELRDSADRVEQVRGWLVEHMEPRKTINSASGGYGLKDLAERDLGSYVANGELIAAAIIAGYTYQIHPESPNASFGMSARSIKVIWKRVHG